MVFQVYPENRNIMYTDLYMRILAVLVDFLYKRVIKAFS